MQEQAQAAERSVHESAPAAKKGNDEQLQRDQAQKPFCRQADEGCLEEPTDEEVHKTLLHAAAKSAGGARSQGITMLEASTSPTSTEHRADYMRYARKCTAKCRETSELSKMWHTGGAKRREGFQLFMKAGSVRYARSLFLCAHYAWVTICQI